MTIFSPHFTVVVVLPPGDHDRFLDAARGPANLYLPPTHVYHTAAWLRATGYNGFPEDARQPPSAHALLGAQRHVAALMDGKDAAWWRAHRSERLGVDIPKETPLTTSCICQMAVGVEPIPHNWFSVPRLLVWDDQPRPEVSYDVVKQRLDVDGVTLFHAHTSMEEHIRMAVFATSQPLLPVHPRATLLRNGWSVAAYPFQVAGNGVPELLSFMGKLFPSGGGAGVVQSTQGARVTTQFVLDGFWETPTSGDCFGPEATSDPFSVAEYVWKRTQPVGHGASSLYRLAVEGLEALCNPRTEIHRPF